MTCPLTVAAIMRQTSMEWSFWSANTELPWLRSLTWRQSLRFWRKNITSLWRTNQKRATTAKERSRLSKSRWNGWRKPAVRAASGLAVWRWSSGVLPLWLAKVTACWTQLRTSWLRLVRNLLSSTTTSACATTKRQTESCWTTTVRAGLRVTAVSKAPRTQEHCFLHV